MNDITRIDHLICIDHQRASQGAKFSHGGAFTLIELLVVISIIALLISILLPALRNARELAVSTQCQSTVRQIALAAQMYADDHDGYLPYGYSVGHPEDDWREVLWCEALVPYMGVESAQPTLYADKWENYGDVYKCPSLPNVFYGYGMNAYGTMYWGNLGFLANRLAFWPEASNKVLFIDAAYYAIWEQSDLIDRIAFRHLNGTNIAYGDLHVATHSGPEGLPRNPLYPNDITYQGTYGWWYYDYRPTDMQFKKGLATLF